MAHDDKKMFKSIYAGYVIFDKRMNAYVGPSSEMWRVALRQHASRFTKAGAMEFISKNTGPNGEWLVPGYVGDFEIQDAV